jgi:hypothetical protein
MMKMSMMRRTKRMKNAGGRFNYELFNYGPAKRCIACSAFAGSAIESNS